MPISLQKEGYLSSDDPNADLVVRVTSKQRLAIGRPSERRAFGTTGSLGQVDKVGTQIIDDRLGFEVENLDTGRSGRAEPVTVGRKHERVDNVTGFERVEVAALVQVPEHRDAVLAARGSERAVGRHGERVDVASVAVVVGLELALVELPDLYYQYGSMGH